MNSPTPPQAPEALLGEGKTSLSPPPGRDEQGWSLEMETPPKGGEVVVEEVSSDAVSAARLKGLSLGLRTAAVFSLERCFGGDFIACFFLIWALWGGSQEIQPKPPQLQ